MASSQAATAPPESAELSPVRVLIVDDSAVIRGLIGQVFDSDPEIEVVGSVGNGQLAIAALTRTEVDVVVLDIEMPVMDGLTALPKLLAAQPDIKVIMASTLTQKNAQISFKALELGATDYLAKPTAASKIGTAADFKRELVTKVKALGAARRSRPRTGLRSRVTPRPVPARQSVGPIRLRPPSLLPPEVIAIGSSTGGPQALFAMLGALPAALKLPILITQHMPATFTTILAEHLARAAKRPAAEAVDGETIVPGRIYLAPGDFHMRAEAGGATRVIRVTKEPPENYCRPAVDPMLRSLASVYGPRGLSVILTGMGSAGAKGGEAVAAAGGTVIAQDEATSVVWGMPGAAAAKGVCSAVLPLPELAPHIAKLALRGSS
ncbi:MAG: chemotaxis response regulator protein-glutamate methylesterase [Proteobacteria bacterium]|nr:chemotaxis response regulator protein-glutamate methylesterase [Pseudomonadota bacterium]